MTITLPADLVEALVMSFRALESRVAGASDCNQAAKEKSAVDAVKAASVTRDQCSPLEWTL